MRVHIPEERSRIVTQAFREVIKNLSEYNPNPELVGEDASAEFDF